MKIHSSCFIAENATVIGDVTIGENCSVWYNAVVRGDRNSIVIGKGTNIQDNAVVHVTKHNVTVIGENVSIGHAAVVHGAKIGGNCLIGMSATVLDGAEIGAGSLIGACALVTKNMKIPENSLVLGVPGKVVKTDKKLVDIITRNAEVYRKLAEEHKRKKYDTYDVNLQDKD
ncbi:MAG: gamma carbonic anhydrase family protein [Thermoplasmatales archaeon]|nr:gamma carbonic anhydrase family protein [Thermoplasmatales archaeon]